MMYYTTVPTVLQYYKQDGTPIYIERGDPPRDVYIERGTPPLYIERGGPPRDVYIERGTPPRYI